MIQTDYGYERVSMYIMRRYS